MDSVLRYLRELFGQAFFIHLPYLDSIGPESIKYMKLSKHVFFGGGNCLSSSLRQYKQWGLDRTNIKHISGVVLMGVGWWQYQPPPDWYTRRALRKVLHRELMHSVRDRYTADHLRRIGIENVLVTGCPTMWSLTDEHCSEIPDRKADNVLVCFTDYNQNQKLDYELARRLQRCYKNMFFWVQAPNDYGYAKGSGVDMEILGPNLLELDQLLNSSMDLDYVGTRLHAGIRALQFKRRSIILGIDNRASEQAKDFSLPVVPRWDLETLFDTIKKTFNIQVQVPLADIAAWKRQFNDGIKS